MVQSTTKRLAKMNTFHVTRPGEQIRCVYNIIAFAGSEQSVHSS